jgi:hypothetical protein
MGQFSMEKSALPGSPLSGNQQSGSRRENAISDIHFERAVWVKGDLSCSFGLSRLAPQAAARSTI